MLGMNLAQPTPSVESKPSVTLVPSPPTTAQAKEAVINKPPTETTSENSVTPKTEAKKSALEEVSTATGSIRSIVIDLLLFLTLVAFVAAGIWEFRRKSVVIDPIDMPKDLAEKGYTPLAVAQRIAAEIRGIQRVARLKGRLEVGFELSSAQIDFTVPSAGISYRGLIRYFRQLLRQPEQRVQGEIVRERTTTRLIGDEISHDVDVVRINLRTRDGHVTSSNLSITSEEELPTLFRKAAFEIASLVDPYLVATFRFREELREHRFEKTYEAIRRCFALTPASEHHRAYFIWGNALSVQRKFNEAELKYRAALRLKSRYA